MAKLISLDANKRLHNEPVSQFPSRARGEDDPQKGVSRAQTVRFDSNFDEAEVLSSNEIATSAGFIHHRANIPNL
jgi:hypothetical protein